MRIVSLLPSATEIVCRLGLRQALVGVTHECDYPLGLDLARVTSSCIPHGASSAAIDAAVRSQHAGGESLYQIDERLLERLQPDLLITQGLCDVCAVSQEDVQAAVAQLRPPPAIVQLEPTTLAEVLQTIITIGEATCAQSRARDAVRTLDARIERTAQRAAGAVAASGGRPRVAFLEWLDPPFSAGHWNAELIALAGGGDALGGAGEPSRRWVWSDLFATAPDAIFIACCGQSVERARQDLPRLAQLDGWREQPAVRADRVYLADGSQYFNRPGPRLVESLEILAHALHPHYCPLPPDVMPAWAWKGGPHGRAAT